MQAPTARERNADRVCHVGWFRRRVESALRHDRTLHLLLGCAAASDQRLLNLRWREFRHRHTRTFGRQQHHTAAVRHLNCRARMLGV
jgi:hypothetical protein